MYCSKCGVQNSDGSTHCAGCGSVLGDMPQQPEVQAVPVMVVEPKTCGLAIAALVMGILSLFCSLVMAIPAIICGIIALVKISKSQGQLRERFCDSRYCCPLSSVARSGANAAGDSDAGFISNQKNSSAGCLCYEYAGPFNGDDRVHERL